MHSNGPKSQVTQKDKEIREVKKGKMQVKEAKIKLPEDKNQQMKITTNENGRQESSVLDKFGVQYISEGEILHYCNIELSLILASI